MADLAQDRKMEIIEHYHRNPEQVLNILVDMQFESRDGYIDQETARLVANELGVTETRIFEEISFYSILKDKPQARYVLKICDSVPCHFTDGSVVRDSLKELLGVDEYELTPDGQFMFHGVPCMGVCEQAPVIKIKDQVFANLDYGKIKTLIEDLRAGKYPAL